MQRFDAIFGKVGRRASRGGCFATDKNEVFANVIVLFGSMSADERSLQFIFTCSLMKLFNTVNIDLIL